jgi:hypothetical protein
MKKRKMAMQSMTFEEACEKYLENGRVRNLREGSSLMTTLFYVTEIPFF